MTHPQNNMSLKQRQTVSDEIAQESRAWKRKLGREPNATERKQIMAIGFSKARGKVRGIPKRNPSLPAMMVGGAVGSLVANALGNPLKKVTRVEIEPISEKGGQVTVLSIGGAHPSEKLTGFGVYLRMSDGLARWVQDFKGIDPALAFARGLGLKYKVPISTRNIQRSNPTSRRAGGNPLDPIETRYQLTTKHSGSSYGIPVLVGLDGRVYGPSDILPEQFSAAAYVERAYLMRWQNWPLSIVTKFLGFQPAGFNPTSRRAGGNPLMEMYRPDDVEDYAARALDMYQRALSGEKFNAFYVRATRELVKRSEWVKRKLKRKSPAAYRWLTTDTVVQPDLWLVNGNPGNPSRRAGGNPLVNGNRETVPVGTTAELGQLRRGDIFIWEAPFPGEKPDQQYVVQNEGLHNFQITALGTKFTFPPTETVGKKYRVRVVGRVPKEMGNPGKTSRRAGGNPALQYLDEHGTEKTHRFQGQGRVHNLKGEAGRKIHILPYSDGKAGVPIAATGAYVEDVSWNPHRAKGNFSMVLESVGNPDFGQYAPLSPKHRAQASSIVGLRKQAKAYIRAFNLGGGNWVEPVVRDRAGRELGVFSYNLRFWPVKGARRNPTLMTVMGANPGRSVKPSKSNPSRRKVTMTLDEFARKVKAMKNPALWKAFLQKVEGYKKWTHGSLPKKVTVEAIDVPGVNGLWMTYDAGKEPEKMYVMPKGSKRTGAWKHEWGTMPDLKNDPQAGIILTKLRGRSRITDFLHKN